MSAGDPPSWYNNYPIGPDSYGSYPISSNPPGWNDQYKVGLALLEDSEDKQV